MGKRGKGGGQSNKAAVVKTKPTTPASPAVINQMQQAYGQTSYSPNAPLLPYPGLQPAQGPRQFAYPIATNLNLVTRDNLTPFQILRSLADLYDGIRICKQSWFDCAAGLEPDIVPAPGLLGKGETADKYADEINGYKDFFESPDRQHTIHEWMNAALDDLTTIDAVAMYPRLTYGGELYSLDLIDGSCYNDEVEILTKSGWKLFQDVNIETDMFATRNPDTKAFEWQKATYFHEADWDSEKDGDLYHFTSRSLDLPVTPNHRMVVNSLPMKLGGSRNTRIHAPGECIVTAKELAEGYTPGYSSLPSTSVWNALDVEEVRLPATTPRSREMVFSGDNFAAFMGMWLAEGCVPNGDQVYITQKPTSKGYEPYKALLERIFGFHPCHTGANFVIGHKALHDYLKQFGHAHEKFIPDIILNMSSRQLAIFWHYYVLGDGHIGKGGRESIRTVSREMVDDLQEILQKMGFSGSIVSHHPKYDTVMKDGRIIRKENKRVAYDLRKRTSRYQIFNVNRMPYKGKVYCVSVPNEVIYVRRNGKPSWCGNTIKPLLDDRGRAPAPPFYAYEQIVYGAPSELFTSDELIYLKEHHRTYSEFGFSRVENILMRVNQALRKQSLDMAMFTDGNIPAGFVSPAADLGWTPDQLNAFQTILDSLYAGNDALRSRLKMMPPGSSFTPTNPISIETVFDLFLFNVTCASFGTTPAEAGFTQDVNRSSGETQADVLYRRTLKPIALRFARLFNFILKKYFNERRFLFQWKGYEAAEDFGALVTAHTQLVGAGIETAGNAALALKLPEQGPDVPRFIMTKDGPFVVDDLANKQLNDMKQQAQMAGLQLAAKPQQPPQEDAGQPNNDDNGNDNEPPQDDKPNAQEDDTASSDDEQENKQPPSVKRVAGGIDEQATEETERLARADLRRWRDYALSRVTAGKALRPFVSRAVPARLSAQIARALDGCTTSAQVRLVFRRAADGQPLWQPVSQEQQQIEVAMHQAILTALQQHDTDTLISRLTTLLEQAYELGHNQAARLIGKPERVQRGAWGGVLGRIKGVLHGIAHRQEQPQQAQPQQSDETPLEDDSAYADMVAQNEAQYAVQQGGLDLYNQYGLPVQWVTDSTPCPICIVNAEAGVHAAGVAFPSGDESPPAHPRCRCQLQPADGYEME